MADRSNAPTATAGSDSAVTLDPVTFEVISHKFTQLISEQVTTLQRTSGSVVVTEASDFAVTLADGKGSVFAIGDTTTMHSIALEHAITWTLENRSENPGIEDGDMFIVSDPWVGVVHQPDMALIAPVFIDGDIVAWAGVCMHMLDTGGVLPGGLNTAATDVFSEAAPIPPIKLVRNTEMQRDVEEMILRRSRLPQLLALDLRAMLATNRVAIDRIRELAERYSTAVVKASIKRQLDNAEAEFRARLSELPDGRWTDTQWCEVARDGDREVYALRGVMEKSGDRLMFDLTETDDEAGLLNSTWPSTKGGLIAAVLPQLCPDLTWAPGGILRAIDFRYRPGSFVAAEFPAPVSAGPIAGGLIATSLATVLIARMLSSASPTQRENMVAVTAACIPANFIRGKSPTGDLWLTVHADAIPGGTGARTWRDGDDYAGLALGPSSRIPNVEHGEHNYPLLWLFRRELPDSGGAGKFRGGVAGESAVIPYGVTEDLEMMVASYGVALPSSRGVNGGMPAKALSFRVYRDVDVPAAFAQGRMPASTNDFGEALDWIHPKTATATIGLHDVFVSSGAGGGGYGDPLERDLELLTRDVTEGYISREQSENIYGVVMSGDAVDAAATERRRAELRGARAGRESIPASGQGLVATEMRRISENVVVTSGGDTTCAQCSTPLAAGSQHFRSGAVESALDMLNLGLVWIDPVTYVDGTFVLKQYSCPTCGSLFETDLVRADEPIADDRRLSVAGEG